MMHVRVFVCVSRYENPDRGSLTADQWDGLFSFVSGGGGLFALHTATACWDHIVEDPSDACECCACVCVHVLVLMCANALVCGLCICVCLGRSMCVWGGRMEEVVVVGGGGSMCFI
jgi:hypothetical protein